MKNHNSFSIFMVLGVFATVVSCSTYRSADSQNYARRHVHTTITVNSTIDQVWSDWTTAEGLEAFYAKKAFVELRANGPYEVWFLPDAPKGERGSEDTVVLGYQENRMLSFTWAMPPYMPEIRPHHTFVQLYFEPVTSARTKIDLYHHGWGYGTTWDEGYTYFENAWPNLLNAYHSHVEAARTADLP